MNKENCVEMYINNVLKKSWTWERLTDEEKERFLNMDVFTRIKGNSKTRIEWLNTVYHSYLEALGYKPIGWRKNINTDANRYRTVEEMINLFKKYEYHFETEGHREKNSFLLGKADAYRIASFELENNLRPF